jgi:hypothetical protein
MQVCGREERVEAVRGQSHLSLYVVVDVNDQIRILEPLFRRVHHIIVIQNFSATVRARSV